MSVMDLTGPIASFASGTYTVTRRSATSYGSDGRLDAPTTSTVSIVASVQPLTGDELARLPEGFQTNELLAVWTATELRTQTATNSADFITINGATWEVQKVERWNMLGNYYKAIVARNDA